METQKNIKQPNATAPTAAKTGSTKQQSGGGAAAASNQDATQGANQGAAQGANKGGTQGATGEQQGGQDLLQQAKQTTSEVVNQVQQRAGSQFSRQKDSAATELSTVANAVRQLGESLGKEENGPIARFAAEYSDKAAHNLERLTTYIRDQEPKQLLDDVQNFGRRRPAWLLGGAFLLGFAGARLIKSSMDAASQQQFHSNAMVPGARPSPTAHPR